MYNVDDRVEYVLNNRLNVGRILMKRRKLFTTKYYIIADDSRFAWEVDKKDIVKRVN